MTDTYESQCLRPWDLIMALLKIMMHVFEEFIKWLWAG